MLLFHLGDSYFFLNELMKTQAITTNENQIFEDYLHAKRLREKRYGRLLVGGVFLPYLGAFFTYRGFAWKAVSFYVLYSSLNAIYDAGVYLHFFVHGPQVMRKIMEMD